MCNPLLAIHHLVPDEIIFSWGIGHNCSIKHTHTQRPPPNRTVINVMVIDGNKKSISHDDPYLSQAKEIFHRNLL